MTLLLHLLCSCVVSQYSPGDKKVGVQLFQWKFTDIKSECVNFLGPNGYGYVQTSPIQEHIEHSEEFQKCGPFNPWWLSYQPTGYEIGNRLGTEEEFIDMVETCNSAGVGIVVDVVLNHFATGNLNTTVSNWGNENTWNSTLLHENFPSPGYTSEHFNTAKCLWEDKDRKRWDSEYAKWATIYCRLFGLLDVDTDHPHVKFKIVEFLDKLVDIGVKGLRIDAAVHIEDTSLNAILNDVKDLPGGGRLYVYHEVLHSNDYGSYQESGRLYDLEYNMIVADAFKNKDGKTIDGITDSLKSTYFGLQLHDNAVVFLNNHDMERVDQWSSRVKPVHYREPEYHQAIIFNLLYQKGVPIIYSGYDLITSNSDFISENPLFPPVDETGAILPIVINSGECQGIWSCQHRKPYVYPLINIRNKIDEYTTNTLPHVSSMGHQSGQIYWGIAGVCFTVIDASSGMLLDLQTGLPKGIYCNVLYADMRDGSCIVRQGITHAGEKITYEVDASGSTTVQISHDDSYKAVVLFYDPSSMISPSGATSIYITVNVNDVAFGENLFVTGEMINWSTCNAIPCIWQNVGEWLCRPLIIDAITEIKIIKHGNDIPCDAPHWYGQIYDNVSVDPSDSANIRLVY